MSGFITEQENRQLSVVEKWLSAEGMTSKAEFCRQNGISPRTLGRWVDKWAYPPKATPINDVVVDVPEEKSACKMIVDIVEVKTEYVISANSATVVRGTESRTVQRDSQTYDVVVQHLIKGEYDKAWELADIKKAIETFSNGVVEVNEAEEVLLHGEVIRNGMADKLIQMVKDGESGVETFAKFMEAVMMDVASDHIREQLWPFLKSQCIELNSDGTFTGYRAVRQDFTDKHSGKFDNSVGQTPSIPRNLVDSDPNNSCSAGLHVGSLDYARSFRSGDDRLIKVKCHVRDVVSVPYDYDAGKLRCCRFTVVEDITHTI